MNAEFPELVSRYLDQWEAYRQITMTVGLVDLCRGSHLDALVCQYLLDATRAARSGTREWRVRDGRVWVPVSYRELWDNLRVPERSARRAVSRLAGLGILDRRVTRDAVSTTASYAIDYESLGLFWEEVVSAIKTPS